MTEEDDVVVCGAGPTGLWVACELAQAGRSVRVFDRKIRRSPHSRATILWPRILELAERPDLCEEIVATGHTFRDLTYYSEKRLAARIRLDSLPHTRYPYGVTIPQDKSLLTKTFEELGTDSSGSIRTATPWRCIRATRIPGAHGSRPYGRCGRSGGSVSRSSIWRGAPVIAWPSC